MRLPNNLLDPGKRGVNCTQVYWLRLDYLEVAAAALRCAAPFTALLYLEHWAKAAHGRLTLGQQDMLGQVWGVLRLNVCFILDKRWPSWFKLSRNDITSPVAPYEACMTQAGPFQEVMCRGLRIRSFAHDVL